MYLCVCLMCICTFFFNFSSVPVLAHVVVDGGHDIRADRGLEHGGQGHRGSGCLTGHAVDANNWARSLQQGARVV